MEELISVIIPAYNCENVITGCLKSVCGQTYKNLEIIVVNDGSEDDTVSILKAWKTEDERIVLIDQENRGVSAARNTALNVARGDYITFIDADDFVESVYVECLYSALYKYNVDICLCNYYVECDRKESMAQDAAGHGKRGMEDAEIVRFTRTNGFNYLRFPDILQSVCCKLYRRTIIGDIRFQEDIYVGEDALFLASVVQKDPVLGYMDRKLYYYIVYQNSTMHKAFDDKKYTVTTAWESIMKMFQDVPEAIRSAGGRYAIQLRDFMIEGYEDPVFRARYYPDMMHRYRRNLKYLVESPEIPAVRKLSGIGFAVCTGLYIRLRKSFRRKRGKAACAAECEEK